MTPLLALQLACMHVPCRFHGRVLCRVSSVPVSTPRCSCHFLSPWFCLHSFRLVFLWTAMGHHSVAKGGCSQSRLSSPKKNGLHWASSGPFIICCSSHRGALRRVFFKPLKFEYSCSICLCAHTHAHTTHRTHHTHYICITRPTTTHGSEDHVLLKITGTNVAP